MNALTIRRTPVRALLHSAVHFGLALAACLIVALPGAADAQRKPRAAAPTAEGADPHAKVMEDDKYPSASKCSC